MTTTEDLVLFRQFTGDEGRLAFLKRVRPDWGPITVPLASILRPFKSDSVGLGALKVLLQGNDKIQPEAVADILKEFSTDEWRTKVVEVCLPYVVKPDFRAWMAFFHTDEGRTALMT